MNEIAVLILATGGDETWISANGHKLASVIGLLIAAFMGFAGAQSLHRIYRSRRIVRGMRNYQQVDGRILKSRVAAMPTLMGQFWVPMIEYEFQVRGKRFTSHGITSSMFQPMLQESEARKKVIQYRAGTAVKVFYDAIDPRYCVLDRSQKDVEGQDTSFDLVLGILGVGLCLFLIFVVFVLLLPGGKKTMPDWFYKDLRPSALQDEGK